jgi:hypothetical protein
MPDLYRCVLVQRDGEWVQDFVCLKRICHGQRPGRPPCEDDEVGVAVWAESGERFVRGQYEWKYCDGKHVSLL